VAAVAAADFVVVVAAADHSGARFQARGSGATGQTA
jgi:hypothetical protein